jgi:hypothetical protein
MVIERLMQPLMIVKLEILFQTNSSLANRIKLA